MFEDCRDEGDTGAVAGDMVGAQSNVISMVAGGSAAGGSGNTSL